MVNRYSASAANHNVVHLIEIIETLKKYRYLNKLSLKDIAESSGMDKHTISALENGRVLNPIFSTLYRYAEAVGVEIKLSLVERSTDYGTFYSEK